MDMNTLARSERRACPPEWINASHRERMRELLGYVKRGCYGGPSYDPGLSLALHCPGSASEGHCQHSPSDVD